ncbi:hypothetical protein JTB14_031381 [Gonioctena quinquepunctata]|nr:hypothetical protein JTB14_031381 [Gonioctena quinquepunctata]
MRNQMEKSKFSALYKSTDSTKADLIKVNHSVGRLEGSALRVCTGVAPTGGNYNIIWKALVDKYQDARSLATSYLDQIMGFKHIEGESAKNLESFLEKFDYAVQALKNLKLQDLADFILMHQALAKLDSKTVESFEMSVRAEVVSTDIYMDDSVCSVPSEEESHRLYLESVAMFAEGKFDLTKRSSSSLHLLEKISSDRRLSQPVLFKTETKILGMIWNPEIDSFRFRFPVPGLAVLSV